MKTTARLLILILAVTTGCGKPVSLQTQTAQQKLNIDSPRPERPDRTDNEAETTIEQPLVSTVNPAEIDTTKYEPLPTEIKTKSATLKLGQTSLTGVKYNYNSKTHYIKVQGHLNIFDSNKQKITETPFELSGNENILGVVTLNQKKRDDSGPTIRAKVTCLGVNQNQDIICDKAIVDFFILYKKQFYTDQFETQDQPKAPTIEKKPPQQPLPIQKEKETEPKPEETESTETAEDLLQEEGKEDSIKGRYEGQVQSTDVVEFLSPEPKKQEPPAEKKQDPPPILNPDVKQSANGNLRPTNQAIGEPDKGSLRNATSIKKIADSITQSDQKFYSVVHNKYFYSTIEMAEIIQELGKFLSTNFDSLKLYVGTLSAINGGRLRMSNGKYHISHQTGIDADLAYPARITEDAEKIKFPVVVTKLKKFITEAYSTEKTFELFKYAFTQQDTPVARIFADQQIINDLCRYAKQNNELSGPDSAIVRKMFDNTQHVDGHGDHFHLRLQCTKNQPRCSQITYIKTNNCML